MIGDVGGDLACLTPSAKKKVPRFNKENIGFVERFSSYNIEMQPFSVLKNDPTLFPSALSTKTSLQCSRRLLQCSRRLLSEVSSGRVSGAAKARTGEPRATSVHRSGRVSAEQPRHESSRMPSPETLAKTWPSIQ